jgi:thiol-disulfide isomerase/thioredoxin
MSNTIELFLTYVRAYSFRIMIAFLFIVFAVVGYYVYTQLYSSAANSTINKFNDVANTSADEKELTIIMYHVDWCPHCKKAMPEWKQFLNEYDGKKINGYKIVCSDIDCTNNKDPNIKSLLDKEPKIDSFPTVRGLIVNTEGKPITIQYKSRISKDNLEKFVLSVSSVK